MEGYKNAGSEADGLPPPYSSPEHQANAAASAGTISTMTYVVMTMIMMIIIINIHISKWRHSHKHDLNKTTSFPEMSQPICSVGYSVPFISVFLFHFSVIYLGFFIVLTCHKSTFLCVPLVVSKFMYCEVWYSLVSRFYCCSRSSALSEKFSLFQQSWFFCQWPYYLTRHLRLFPL